MPQHTPNAGETKSQFMDRCMADGGAHDECALQFDRARGLSILAFANDPELSFVPHAANPMFFDKDILKVGTYTHPSDGWTVDIDVGMIDNLVDTFNTRKANGNDTEIVVDHKAGADDVVGYLEGMRRVGDSLIATHGMTCQRGVDLANTVKNVSVMIDHDCKDGKGNDYGEAITHSAICQQPVVNSQDPFVRLSLNNQAEQKIPVLFLSAVATEEPMKKTMLATLKAMLGTEDDVTEKNALSLIDTRMKKMSADVEVAEKKATDLDSQIAVLKAAKGKDDPKVDPEVIEDRAESAEERFDTLVEKGNIIPSVAASLKGIFVGPAGSRNAFALSGKLSGHSESIVKQVIKALAQNDVVRLAEQTGRQVLKPASAIVPDGFNQGTLDTMISMANGGNGDSDATLKKLLSLLKETQAA